MNMNPLQELRYLSELTQQQVAVQTGTSQQFVQRLEQGASAHVSQSISSFYDRTVSVQTRRNILADLLTYADAEDVENLRRMEPSTVNLYRLWVHLTRKRLPEGLDLIVEETNSRFQPLAEGKKESVAQHRHNMKVAHDFVVDCYNLIVGPQLAFLSVKNDVSIATMIQQVAQTIHVHPFVLERFVRFGAVVVPPSVSTAIYKGSLNVGP